MMYSHNIAGNDEIVFIVTMSRIFLNYGHAQIGNGHFFCLSGQNKKNNHRSIVKNTDGPGYRLGPTDTITPVVYHPKFRMLHQSRGSSSHLMGNRSTIILFMPTHKWIGRTCQEGVPTPFNSKPQDLQPNKLQVKPNFFQT